MLLCNESYTGKFPELFLKQLPITSDTVYRLTFDQLGGAIGVWVNRHLAEQGAGSHHFADCCEWTARELVFSVNNRVGKVDAFRDWGISFFKKNESRYMCGLDDTYVANIQLTTVEEPYRSLLPREAVTPPPNQPHITDAVDPNSDRPVLVFRSLMTHPPHPDNVPIQAHTFGYIKDQLFRITRRHPYGVPYHCLAFAERECILLEDGTRVNAEHAVYIPPNTPFHYTFERRGAAQYYWVEFSGSAADAFLADLPFTPFTPIALRRTASLTTHIEQMLQQSHESPLYPYAVSSHLQLLLAELRHQLCADNDNEQQRRIQAVATQLQQSTLLPSNEELAAENGFSTGHFIRLFKAYMGCTPHRYALRCRLEKARELLKTTPMTVQEVAYAVGFEDPQYFSRTFRADVGLSPREYRKR